MTIINAHKLEHVLEIFLVSAAVVVGVVVVVAVVLVLVEDDNDNWYHIP